jgi:hypothetical protein
MSTTLLRPGLRLASRGPIAARLYSGTGTNPQTGPARKSPFQAWFAVEVSSLLLTYSTSSKTIIGNPNVCIYHQLIMIILSYRS